MQQDIQQDWIVGELRRVERLNQIDLEELHSTHHSLERVDHWIGVLDENAMCSANG